MKLVISIQQIWRGYTGVLRWQVYYTWLVLLIGNRFLSPAHSGVAKIIGKQMQYSHRGSLYGMFSEIFIEQNYYTKTTDASLLIIDAGANIGMASLYFSIRAPRATIIAFEPNPATAAILQENVERNKLPVTVHVAGLAAQEGLAQLFTDEADAASQSASMTGHLETKSRPMVAVDITLHTLSQYLRDKKVDILKLDIEGSEGEVLEEVQAARMFANIGVLFIEYHYDGVHTVYPLGQFLSILSDSDYAYVVHSGILFPFMKVASPLGTLSYKITAWKK